MGYGFFDKPKTNREKQLAKIALLKQGTVKKLWCRRHPTGVWEAGFPRCAQGHKRNEFCQRGE